jgi:hypothetical protein
MESVSDIPLESDHEIGEEEPPVTGKLPFVDVKDSDWYYQAVKSVYAAKLFLGTSSVGFSPLVSMTRAMFVQVLANLEKVDLFEYSQPQFTDVPDTQWFSKPIAWANAVRLVSGTGEGEFAPEREITREEMAVMLYNYINWKGVEIKTETKAPFGDFDEVSKWAQEAVNAIQGYGIINGVGDNMFAPKRTASRAEVAQIFANYLEM